MPPVRTSDASGNSDRTRSPYLTPLRNLSVSTFSCHTVSSQTTDGSDKPDSVESLGHAQSQPTRRVMDHAVSSKSSPQGAKAMIATSPDGQSLLSTFTICGVELKPTVAFDTFWRFAAERKAIDDRRRAGQPAPWTDDPILQKYFFCNTYRVLDKLSQYIITEVVEKGSQDPIEVVFRVILFNTFTKIETWELLRQNLGTLTWASYDRQKYQKVLSSAKKSGDALYTAAFIKPAPHFGHAQNYMNHLCLLEVFMENEMPYKLLDAPSLADVYEYIISFPSMGDFTTYQLMLNLSYTKVLNFHQNDFVLPGPGALSGLGKMFGRSMAYARSNKKDFGVDIIRWLAETQLEHFKRLGITFSALGPDQRLMDVADIEHTLCEVDKYCRLAHPGLKGKRTEIRRYFTASSGNYHTKPVFPEAWSHPARKTPRLRADQTLVVEKRYTINRIAKHRQGKFGREFLVYWIGYPDSDATWEPEEGLLADAPAIVEGYLTKQKSK